MRDMYIKTGLGFLLVFSITSAASLEELANLRDEIIRIKDDENVPIVIVGNKADLEENRAVPRAKGFSISQRWEAPYYESSARTKSECLYVVVGIIANLSANVDEVFVDLCRQMLRRDDDVGFDDGNDDYHHDGGLGGSQKRRRRRRLRDGNVKCVVL